MDKDAAKRVFAGVGIPCAEGVVAHREPGRPAGDALQRPFVVKPTDEGSSVGVRIVADGRQRRPPAIADDFAFGDEVDGRALHRRAAS